MVYRCRNCGHVFLDLGMDPGEVEAFLTDFYRKDTQRQSGLSDLHRYVENIKADNIRRLELCQKHLQARARVLDVGAGYGLFSYLVKPFVSEVTVVDQSELARANAKRFGLRYASDVDSLDGRFSLIVAFHTVEHFVNPVRSLASLASLLDEHGVLVIEVPNVEDLLVKMSRGYRPFYYQTAHLHYFSPQTLEAVLKRAGLKVIESIPTQRYGLSNHVRWVTGRRIRAWAWLERGYRGLLSRTRWSDTLLYICELDPDAASTREA